MLAELFEEQKQLIDDFFNRLNMEQLQAVLEAFVHCSGTIIFTGVGKSGMIAKKIAMTMLSTGTKAMYLSSINALHGDIGMVDKDDIFVLISKSGESDELCNLVPYVRNKGAFPISVTCTASSRLAKACDLNVELPLKKELCPFDLAPTTSAVLQLIFGDVLLTAVMKQKKFSLDQYAKNHPSGRIGRRSTVGVRDLMLPFGSCPLCEEKDILLDVLDAFSEKACGCLLVIDDERHLKGIYTDGDLRRSLQQQGPDFRKQSMKDLMTADPKSVSVEALAWDALKMMEENQKQPVTVLPVLEGKVLVGLIKMHDIVQAGIS